MLAAGRVSLPTASTCSRQAIAPPCALPHELVHRQCRHQWRVPLQRVRRPHRAQAAARRAAVCIAAGNGAIAAPRVRPQYVPHRIEDPNYVRIFDTTLRDGEQSPGATLTHKEKLDIARQLAKLGVDIIEAGFPQASPGDFAAVQAIAETVGRDVDADGYVPVICGLARCKEGDAEVQHPGSRHAHAVNRIMHVQTLGGQ